MNRMNSDLVMKKSNLFRNAYFVFQKDLKLEFRTRFAINAIFLFAVTTLIVVSFSISGAQLSPNLLSSLLWVILFFSSISGLSHIFIREEEQQTADTLRLVTSPNAVFLGKWLFNIILLFGLEVIIVPLYLAFMNLSELNVGILLVILILGSIGLASVDTIVAAIISRASSKGALFAVLSFPVSITILVSAIHGTNLAFQKADFFDCISDVQVLLSFSVVIITISLLLFEFIWRD
jgi:heme exporter protein B